MKKILYFISILFVLTVGDASSQTKVNLPWMFYPQQTSFQNTPYCIKYKCSDSQFKNNPQEGLVDNFHNLFRDVYSWYSARNSDAPFDVVYSAIYKASTIRYPIFPKNKFGAIYAELAMNREIRYGEPIARELRKGILNPRMYALVSDFLFSMVGKRYSKNQIIKCYQTKESIDRFDEFVVPRKFPAGQLPLSEEGPGPFNILVSINCNGFFDPNFTHSNLLEIRLGGMAALDALPSGFPNR
jgi:hypothetical protein